MGAWLLEPPAQISGDKLFPATDPHYNDFLKTYGVWGKDNTSAAVDSSFPIFFPETGEYVIKGACDNIGEFFIDDKAVLSTPIGKPSLRPQSPSPEAFMFV